MNDQCGPPIIVCFGDSLTLGFQSPTRDSPFPEAIPYGTYLQEQMGGRGCVLIRGVCGETTQDMRMRFQVDVLDQQPQVAIILGGTNDLGVGISPSVIVENLNFFYGQAQSYGVRPVAVTIPSLRGDVWLSHEREGEDLKIDCFPEMKHAIAQRMVLNTLLKDLAKERNIPVVDWFVETCEPETKVLAAEFSNDGLHLTTAGYQKLAEMIWSQVLIDLL